MAKYDAASTKAIVPHPRLRAGLLALQGTVGEPAIRGALDGTYKRVRFGTPAENSTAQVVPRMDSEGNFLYREIVFNEKFRYEDFRLLASTMTHEPLHRDSLVSSKEELAANSIDTIAYAQFVVETPRLVTFGTHLTRSKNTELLARLNTRDANGKLRLFTSQGNVFPGGNFMPYFAAPFEPLGDDTPGNAVLKGEVKGVVGPNVALPRTVNFDNDTLLLLDSTQKVFTNAQLVKLATILKLDTSPPATTAQRAQETTTNEQPVPSWQEIYGAE